MRLSRREVPSWRVREAGPGVWVFRSERFANQLSALISLGDQGLLIDPPMFPEEAERIVDFASGKGLTIGWLSVTHAHGDHAYGMAFFPDVPVIAHRNFWPFWQLAEEAETEYFRRVFPGFSPPHLREPDVAFSRELVLRMGGREVRFLHLPGHSPDGLLVKLPREGIWVVGDSVIPIPYLASGDRRELLARLRGLLLNWRGQTIVMGHDAVLFGAAAKEAILDNIRYLEWLGEEVERALAEGKRAEEVLKIPLSKFGVPASSLGGIASQLHRVNLERTLAEFGG